jgi:hypothetical protein
LRKGDEIRPHSAEALGDQEDEGGRLKLGLLEGDERGLCRRRRTAQLGLLEGDKEGWAESLGNADGELECPVDGSDEGP